MKSYCICEDSIFLSLKKNHFLPNFFFTEQIKYKKKMIQSNSINKLLQKPRILLLVVTINFILMFFFFSNFFEHKMNDNIQKARETISRHYPHFNKYDSNSTVFEIVLVADMDKVSKVKKKKEK